MPTTPISDIQMDMSALISPTPDPIGRLDLATGRLHEAFSSIEPNPEMVRCPVTVSDHDVRSLCGDVRSLPAPLVARFVLKAGTTWGGPDDLRRVVPRAVELAAEHQLPVDRGLLWAKLRWAGWTAWPTYQMTTLREHSRAEWGRLLRSAPRPAHLAHRWLRDAANGVDDLGPFLLDWTEAVEGSEPAAHHRAATGHLVLLLSNSPFRPDVPRTVQDLAPGHPEVAITIREWLSSQRLVEALEGADRALAGTSDSRRVGLALDRLGRYRSRVVGSSSRLAAGA